MHLILDEFRLKLSQSSSILLLRQVNLFVTHNVFSHFVDSSAENFALIDFPFLLVFSDWFGPLVLFSTTTLDLMPAFTFPFELVFQNLTWGSILFTSVIESRIETVFDKAGFNAAFDAGTETGTGTRTGKGTWVCEPMFHNLRFEENVVSIEFFHCEFNWDH